MADEGVVIRKLGGALEAAQCARLMSSSEPWQTLGRDYGACLAIVEDPAKEVYVAWREGRFLGFVVLELRGVLRGYIQTIVVQEDARNKGVGAGLIHFAERRIWQESPNVFLCVSSFNGAAQRLYRRLGYITVGELPDFLVRGHSELLLRKTSGPWHEFTPRKT